MTKSASLLAHNLGLLSAYSATVPSFLSIELCTSSGCLISLASACSEVHGSINCAISEVSKVLHCPHKAAPSFVQILVSTNYPSDISNGKPCILKCAITKKRFDLPEDFQVWFSEVGTLGEIAIADHIPLSSG